MADEQRERLESFRAFIKAVEEGASIPPVAEDDSDACTRSRQI
jgi:hypothetical protein